MKRRDFFKFTGKGFAALFAAVIVGVPKIKADSSWGISPVSVAYKKLFPIFEHFDESLPRFEWADTGLEFEADVGAAAEQIKKDLIRADELTFG